MRRVFVGLMALGAVALVLGSGRPVEAGLFSRLFGGNDDCNKAKATCGKPAKSTCCKPKPTCCGSKGQSHTPKVEDAPAPPPTKAPAPPKPKKGKKA